MLPCCVASFLTGTQTGTDLRPGGWGPLLYAGILAAGAGERQLTAAVAASRAEMTRDGNPHARAFQSRGSCFCVQLAALKKQDSSELGLCLGEKKYQLNIIMREA